MNLSFTEKHRNLVGYISNQNLDEFNKDRSLVSVSVCPREECQTKARQYVAGSTNETAVFYPYKR